MLAISPLEVSRLPSSRPKAVTLALDTATSTGLGSPGSHSGGEFNQKKVRVTRQREEKRLRMDSLSFSQPFSLSQPSRSRGIAPDSIESLKIKKIPL